jgi:uncharacterized protein
LAVKATASNSLMEPAMRQKRQRLISVLLFLLVGLELSRVQASPYEPLNCSTASTASLAAICKNYALGQDEARQATLFSVLTSLVAMGQRADLVEAQRRWIAVREACGEHIKCLSTAYKTRIEELSQAIETLAKRGPY